MEGFRICPIPVLRLFIFLSFITSSLSEITDFVSCLTSNDVKNFTLPVKLHHSASNYDKILDFSIQNLRFAEPAFSKPTAVVLPESKEQLASAVLCYREQESWEIRVRSGGHSYEGLSFVDEEAPFVLIDLMNLNRVSVELESKTAWVEAGATLGETYHAIAIASNSLGFSAGSCPTVGSGGHIGGGGFGLLSRKYGLAADNVIDAILIDSYGRVLDREGMGEDVFWAIRGGGGGGWGVVYAWKIKLVPVPKIVTSCIISRPGSRRRVSELVHKWQFVAPKVEDNFYLSVFVGADLPETATIGVSATFKSMYLGPKANMMSTTNEIFPELGLVEGECKEMSWIESIVYFSGLKEGSSIDHLKDRVLHGKNFFKAKSDYVRNPLSLRKIQNMMKAFEAEPKGYVIMDPYGGMMSRITSDSLPFPHRHGNLYAIQYLVCWEKEDDWRSKDLMNWIRRFYEYMTDVVSKSPRAAYTNYLDLDLGVMEWTNRSIMPRNAVEVARTWGEKYFLANFDRLVRAKTLIDPYNVFRNPQSIPPLDLERGRNYS